MSIAPLISFKAGTCSISDSNPPRIKPDPRPGYLYLYKDGDDLLHFCWRTRSALVTEPDLDLVMMPEDAHFDRYLYSPDPPGAQWRAPTNGRIAVLKFSSSSDRHLFWLQSKAQGSRNDPSWWSRRDKELVMVVDQLVNGSEVDVQSSLLNIPADEDDDDDDADDGDEQMEDAEPQLRRHESAGGAGPDATGGDVREEGEDSREGGEDGARAVAAGTGLPTDASALVQNFLKSIGTGQRPSQPFTTLNDLLTPATVLPTLDKASTKQLDSLLSFLPAEIPVLYRQESDAGQSLVDSGSTTLSDDQKRSLLRRVIQSPQFQQSLASLTGALSEGGLPSVSEALGVKVPGGGYSLAGGEAVKAFVEGVKANAKAELEKEPKGDDSMNVD